MPKWEYAAILKLHGGKNLTLNKSSNHSFERWVLVQPGNEPHTIRKRLDSNREFYSPYYPWKDIPMWERRKDNEPKINDSSPKVLFEATDVLVLVNLAGAEGWEITGALGTDFIGIEHRMMRREL